MLKYSEINTPEELLNFMKQNFEYGFIDNKGNKYKCFNDDWFNIFFLQKDNCMLNSKCGSCFDAVEFERYWFNNHNYEFKTIFEMVKLDYQNSYPMHAFLVYKENNKWHYFEWADYNNQGIYSYNLLSEALNYQYKYYEKILNELKIKPFEKEKFIRKHYNKPINISSAEDFLKFVQDSNDI